MPQDWDKTDDLEMFRRYKPPKEMPKEAQSVGGSVNYRGNWGIFQFIALQNHNCVILVNICFSFQ